MHRSLAHAFVPQARAGEARVRVVDTLRGVKPLATARSEHREDSNRAALLDLLRSTTALFPRSTTVLRLAHLDHGGGAHWRDTMPRSAPQSTICSRMQASVFRLEGSRFMFPGSCSAIGAAPGMHI